MYRCREKEITILKFLYISILLAEERKKTRKPQNQIETKLLVLKTRSVILRNKYWRQNQKGKKKLAAAAQLKTQIIISISWLLSIWLPHTDTVRWASSVYHK